MVTEFDRSSEALIVAGIREARPDDGIVGEEGTDRPGTTGVDWLIDPIDGTTNFLYAPARLLGVDRGTRRRRPPRRAWCTCPTFGETFTAMRGGGAWCNGEPIHCTDQGRRRHRPRGHRLLLRRRRAGPPGRRAARGHRAGARHPPVRVGRRRPVLRGRRPGRRLLRAGPAGVGPGGRRTDRPRGRRAVRATSAAARAGRRGPRGRARTCTTSCPPSCWPARAALSAPLRAASRVASAPSARRPCTRVAWPGEGDGLGPRRQVLQGGGDLVVRDRPAGTGGAAPSAPRRRTRPGGPARPSSRSIIGFDAGLVSTSRASSAVGPVGRLSFQKWRHSGARRTDGCSAAIVSTTRCTGAAGEPHHEGHQVTGVVGDVLAHHHVGRRYQAGHARPETLDLGVGDAALVAGGGEAFEHGGRVVDAHHAPGRRDEGERRRPAPAPHVEHGAPLGHGLEGQPARRRVVARPSGATKRSGTNPQGASGAWNRMSSGIVHPSSISAHRRARRLS